MKLSWTSYNSLENCGLSYELKYVRRVRMPSNQKVFLVGRVVHNTVGAWVKAGYPNNFIQPELRQALIGEFAHFRLSDAEMQQYADRAVRAATATERIYRLLELQEHGAIIEEWFDVPLSGAVHHRLHGAADVYDPVRKMVFDLKNYSGGNSGDLRQLLTYAVAFAELGRPVEEIGFIYPLRVKRQIETYKVKPDEIARQRESLVAATRKIDAKQWGGAFPGDHCRWCEFFASEHCPVTQRETGTRDLPPGVFQLGASTES